MANREKIVNGFRFMPPSLGAWIKSSIPEEPFKGTIPWTPLKKPVSECVFSLMTTAGISMKQDPPFDMEREKREPAWGDPGYRTIPKDAAQTDIDVNHLHINTDYIKEDIDVMLPINRFKEFEAEGVVGGLAPTSYSYYGFQWDPTELLNETMPKVASRMKDEGVDSVLLTPA